MRNARVKDRDNEIQVSVRLPNRDKTTNSTSTNNSDDKSNLTLIIAHLIWAAIITFVVFILTL